MSLARLLTPTQWALVLFIAVIQLWIAGRFDLTQDEAHYALFAYHLDWSYFDHPPMVGWLQALILPLSDSDTALRLWPIIFHVATAWALLLLLRTVYPNAKPQTQWLVLALFLSQLMLNLLGLSMLPDTPLQLWTLLAAWAMHQALIENKAPYWLWIGVFLGLAGLSKYTSVTLVISVIVLMTLCKRWTHLTTPWPWLAVMIAAALIAPVLYWNANHEWISFAYQLGHGTHDGVWKIQEWLTSLAGQVVVYSPFLMVAIIGFIWMHRVDWTTKESFWFAMAVPGLALFAWTGGYEPVLPHWTAISWLLLLPAAAVWLTDKVWWSRLTVVYAAFITVAFLGALAFPSISLNGGKQNPVQEVQGWPEASALAVALLQQSAAAEPQYLFASNWSTASQLAWYARPSAVRLIEQKDAQISLWYGSPASGNDGILVVPSKYTDSEKDSGIRRFERCDYLPESNQLMGYRLYRCQNLL